MTDITPLIPEGRKVVKSYGAGRFNISGEVFESSVVILPEQVLPWSANAETILGDAAFESLIPHLKNVGILLVGTGAQQRMLDFLVLRTLKAHGIIAEAMDTGAACRTYNVLLSEERNVAAALIFI